MDCEVLQMQSYVLGWGQELNTDYAASLFPKCPVYNPHPFNFLSPIWSRGKNPVESLRRALSSLTGLTEVIK